MNLNDVHRGIKKNKKKQRVGRGPGSGHGKTSGRGHKGQGQLAGWTSHPAFEGGQMPLHRRLPKRGFTNIFRQDFVEVGLDRIEVAIAAGRLDAGETIDAAALKAAGIVKNARDGVRLLGGAEPKRKLTIDVAGASRPAIAAVEKAGGTVKVAKPAAPVEATS